MTDAHDAHDAHDEYGDDAEEDAGREWPIKGPATAQQAILAIGFVFFLGIVVGFLLCRTF
jgi:hypothetical protein